MGNQGYIHSIESMGVFDGPGIRTVFFLQGCPLRCAYCHNPDTQAFSKEKSIEPSEVLRLAKRYRLYYGKDGGVTFSGGEPLSQGAFVSECLKLLKEEGIHTCIDTSGAGDPAWYREILPYTDLILLDIKQFDASRYLELTERDWKAFWRFAGNLGENGFKGKLWLRHVMMPGVSDNIKAMEELLRLIEPLRPFTEKIEILPYHTMGIEKYKKLGRPYRLEGMPAMDKKKAKVLEAYVNQRFFNAAAEDFDDEERKALIALLLAPEGTTVLELSENELRSLPLLGSLGPEDFAEAQKACRSLALKPKELLFESGRPADKLYIIHSGRLKISRRDKEGREQILYIFNPGEFLGGLNLLSGEPFHYDAHALEDCRICEVPKSFFEAYMARDPEILKAVSLKSYDRIRKAEDLISRLYADKADIKAASLLLRLSEDEAVETSEGQVCFLRMEAEELAAYAGLSPEVLREKLKEFSESGYIEAIGRDTILIKNKEALERMLDS